MATRIVKSQSARAAEAAVDPRLAKARAEHAAKKASAEPEVLEPLAAPVDEQSTVERLAANAQRAFDELATKLGMASPARYLCSAVLALLASAGVGWLIGQITGWLMVGVLMATGSAFLMWVTFVLGVIGVVVTGYIVSGQVFDYVVTKKVDAHWAKLKGSVTGLFARKPEVAAA